MPMTPMPNWIKTFQPEIEDYFSLAGKLPGAKVEKAWQNWINGAAKGINAAPPYDKSKGTLKPDAFSPLKFPKKGTPPTAAIVFATAWKNWYLGIKWNPCPPVPPFSVIQKVESSPSGVEAAYAILVAGLTAEFLKVPKNPKTAFKIKSQKIATLFYNATFAAGVQISGLDTAGSSPLTIPLSPIM